MAALAAVAGLHLLGFGLLLLVALPAHVRLEDGQAFGVGLGLTAYALGLRHAFDPDHIAAIDNTTRKLLGEGGRPDAAGFFFSAGHSTVVLLLSVLVALGVRGAAGAVRDDGSTVLQVAGVWGPTVAGLFLVLVALVNLSALRRTVRQARRARRGNVHPDACQHGAPRGVSLVGRAIRGLSARVTAPWQLYPLGFMFGLGFDTATEIALLLLAGGGAAGGVPILAILALPILFAAGMTLLDTLNGAAMTRAYGWALAAPTRRIAYDAAVTGTSVIFAFVIGTLSLVGVLVDQAGIGSGPLAWLARIDVGLLGVLLLAAVLSTWAVAAVWWRMGERAASAA